MEVIRVVVNGALGKMGREVTHAVLSDSDLKMVGSGVSTAARNLREDTFLIRLRLSSG